MGRNISIGIQRFNEIIENDYFYVDKTLFIKEWWKNGDTVTLITRPRRFGKTLTISMVEQFFSVKYAGRSDLFEGLSIWKEETYHALQGAFPVISLSFANVKESTYAGARKKIFQMLAELYADHAFLLESGVLEEADKEYFKRVSIQMDDVDAAVAVHNLSKYLYRYYGKNVIILLDEYDTPMQEAYVAGFWDEFVGFIRNLFNATFKTNPWLERALMTGITRVSKESVFSDLNNPHVVTTTSNYYTDSFGFTREEVEQTLEEYGLAEQKESVKDWYDGFVFGRQKGIYNPWSIINFLKNLEYGTYWANTSSNGLVSKLIREGSADIKIQMEDLLAGKTLHTQIDEQIVYNQLDHSQSAIWSLLLACGYLKVENYVVNMKSGRKEYDLALTNKEVHIMFSQLIQGWFADRTPSYNDFIKALLLGDRKAMNTYMNRTALATFSYFDTGKRPSAEAEPERFYHGFVLGLMVDLSERYQITSNRESGFGRYDVLLWPKSQKDDGIILEFKVHDPEEEKDLGETAQKALQQIELMKYEAMLIEGGFPKERIRKYGFAFEGKKVLIK